jgi:predicted lipopolysaccharide heptosyltransferase III
MKNILLIRLSSLGDIVLTSPAIRAVRQHFPQAHISMLVAKQSADLLTENPHLDEVIPFDRKAGNKDTGEMRRIIRHLRERHFDLAIDFQRKFRTSLLAYMSGAKCRVGYHQPNGFLCTVRVPDRNNKAIRARRIASAHAIDRYFEMLHAIGVEATDRTLELFITHADRAFSDEIIATKGIEADRTKVGLFPGAGWKLREWMPDRFAAIGDRVAKQFDAQVLLFGGPHEGELVQQVGDLMTTEAISLAGNLRIRQLAALIEQCDLFVTNDTGPMHVAAAMQTPTVALFGPGDHIRFQPLDPIHTTIRHHVPCNPCKQFTNKCKNNICMKLITVDEVWETVQQNLSNLSKTATYCQ